MEREIAEIKAALIELADDVESGDTKGLGERIRNILDSAIHVEPRRPQSNLSCNCAKCWAIRKAENTPDDFIN